MAQQRARAKAAAAKKKAAKSATNKRLTGGLQPLRGEDAKKAFNNFHKTT